MPPQTKMNGKEGVKQCCAALYQSDFARLLLGDSFHPGGLKLTERLGELLALNKDTRVLDVAAGKGTSAFFLAERFGCSVVGADWGEENVSEASQRARDNALSPRVSFEKADAEYLPFRAASFDAIICECSFCTFPDKAAAAHEFARVLRAGGRVGLSDLTRNAALPKELDSLLSWIACIADAQSTQRYADFFSEAGLHVELIEPHDDALLEMIHQIRMKLLGAEIMAGLKKLDLPEVNFPAATEMAKHALLAVQQGVLGYAAILASKPTGQTHLDGHQ